MNELRAENEDLLRALLEERRRSNSLKLMIGLVLAAILIERLCGPLPVIIVWSLLMVKMVVAVFRNKKERPMRNHRIADPPTSYAAAVAEGRRVAELEGWVHLALLTEFVINSFLVEMPKKTAIEKFLKEIRSDYTTSNMLGLMRAASVWKKTSKAVRKQFPAAVYYKEAASYTPYRQNKINATRAVLHQRKRPTNAPSASTSSPSWA